MTQNVDTNFIAGLAGRFNALNRAILAAEKPEEWQPAITQMNAFLAEIESWLQANPEQIAEDLVTSSRVFSLLLTLAATGTQGRLELYQPKGDAASQAYRRQLDEDYLPATAAMRRKALSLAHTYLTAPAFSSLTEDIRYEVLPLLESLDQEKDPDRFMAYRVIQVGNI